jgi:hypothetical protein
MFSFSGSWSCVAGCPIAGRDLMRKATRLKLKTVAMLGQCCQGNIRSHYTPESRVCRDALRPEIIGDIFGSLSRYLIESLEKREYSVRCDTPLSPATLADQFISFINGH